MEAKHTQGPWKMFVPCGEGDYGIISDNVNAGGNFYVATIPNGRHAEAEANARLIAAAPNMLEALEQIASDKPNSDKFALMAIARAAIQAATGE
jgi:hypothetical protein